jgi:hypothetical protein
MLSVVLLNILMLSVLLLNVLMLSAVPLFLLSGIFLNNVMQTILILVPIKSNLLEPVSQSFCRNENSQGTKVRLLGENIEAEL